MNSKNPITGKRRSRTVASGKSGYMGFGTTALLIATLAAFVIKKAT